MAELTISPEEIRSAISSYVSSLETETSREEVGAVADTGDGIAHVEGLPSAMTNELLEFEGGVLGVALNLDVREIGAVILGPFGGIEEGQPVKRTGSILSVPVGDDFLGRVIDPLEGTQDHHADRPDVEVQRHAQGAVGELQQLVRHRRGQSLDVGDAVAGVGDDPDLFAGRLGRVRRDVALQCAADLVG